MRWFSARDVEQMLFVDVRLLIEDFGSFVDWERRFSVFAMLEMF
jgi:hypothetical protein